MKKIIGTLIGTGILMLLLTACNFDGTFRYPCQDPANWENAECKPPVCVVNGACPEDLVGDAYNQEDSGSDTIITEEVPGEEE